MNENARDNATNWPVSLKNKATPDAAVFACTTPATTVDAAAATTIFPGGHIPPSGGKQHAKPSSPVNMKKMAKKDTIYTNPAPPAPTAVPVNAYARSPGFTVSSSPSSLRNRNFPTSSIVIKKTKKGKKYKWW